MRGECRSPLMPVEGAAASEQAEKNTSVCGKC